MDWMQLLQQGAAMIQNNSDEATTGLDVGQLTEALSGVLGGQGGQIDIASLVQQLQQGGLAEAVMSWVGSGENMPVSAEQITAALGQDKVQQFAQKLGLSEGSAAQALADALPAVVDQATNADDGLAQQLLGSIGGAGGAMDMLKKLF